MSKLLSMRIALLLLLAFACTAPQPPPGAAGPSEAVQDLSDALHKGDTATAWSLLSKRTQAAADEEAAAARTQADGGPESGRQMLLSGALPGRAVHATKISQSGDSAEVQTTDDAGQIRTWHAVREGGVWHVDLDLEARH
jgi:hypothetical protein